MLTLDSWKFILKPQTWVSSLLTILPPSRDRQVLLQWALYRHPLPSSCRQLLQWGRHLGKGVWEGNYRPVWLLKQISAFLSYTYASMMLTSYDPWNCSDSCTLELKVVTMESQSSPWSHRAHFGVLEVRFPSDANSFRLKIVTSYFFLSKR